MIVKTVKVVAQTVVSQLRAAAQQLAAVSTTPQLEAELLLAQVLQLTRAQLYICHQQVLTADAQQDFQHLLTRRLAAEPMAYLLGYREFWSLEFKVTPATLIPRPETELLIELLLQKFPADAEIKVVDLGTGCGAIALALAHERPRWSVVATDYSEAALAVARDNATRLQINNVSFRQGSWCSPLAEDRFHALVSNPPYLRSDDEHLQGAGLSFEPITALVSADRGLADIQTIISQARKNLLPAGWLLLEHGYDQSRAIQQILQAHDYSAIVGYTDLEGLDRVVTAQID